MDGMNKLTKFPRNALWTVANSLGLHGPPAVANSPGLDDAALECWRSVISDGGVYLEYGSGGSTVEASRHATAIVTVETDWRYLRAVGRKVAELQEGDAPDFYPIHVDIGWTWKWGRPLFTWPTKARLARWRRYSSAPWDELEFHGLTPHFIFIDGRFRAASVLESLIRLPDDADCLIMLDDFADREARYGPIIMPFIGDVQRAGRALLFRRAAAFSSDDCARQLAQVQADFE